MAIDINSATPEELVEATGIAPEVASAICEYRDDNGDFLDMAEVSQVPGVGEDDMVALGKAGVKVGAGIDTESGGM